MRLKQSWNADAISRLAQGLLAGIGFLGAGTILKLTDKGQVRGLTTAASIWLAAAVGMTCGHHVLVAELRRAAADHPDVRYLPGACVQGIEGQRLCFTGRGRTGGLLVPDPVVLGRVAQEEPRSLVRERQVGVR